MTIAPSGPNRRKRRANEKPGIANRARMSALKLGRWAEHLAVLRLRLGGYRILARNLRLRSGEIDILARRGSVLALIEVKARADFDAAAFSLLPRQRQRLERSAEALRQRWPDLSACALRFDVVLVRPWRLPRHLPDAWRPDGRPGRFRGR